MKLRFVFVPLVLTLGWVLNPGHAQAPQATTTSTTTTTTTTTSTTTTTLPPAHHAECAPWLGVAATIGWDEATFPMLERVMWKESRCDPTQFNADDPNGGSVGLTQVNRFWCLPSRYYPDGYLQAVGVLAACDDLWNPEVNLRAALAIYEYAEGWSQWGL
jgi:hypothetical protein